MRRLLRLCFALLVGFAPLANAQSTQSSQAHPFEIEAGSMEYEFRRKLYVARAADDGRVVIRQKQRTLTADWVAYSRITRRGVASGNVVLSDGEDELRTAFVEFDIDTLEGVMFDAEFIGISTPLELRGAEIAKTGERTYRFREGRFTACRCPDPEAVEPWEVTAEEADLEVEGYGTARNSTVEVLGVPVLWLPWMIYPLKTERQSGLLFPEFGYSGRSGAEIGLPIFWAAADPVNVILTPQWLSKRGAKGNLSVEYVLGERSGGSFFGAGLYDEDVTKNSLETPFSQGRWATAGSHEVFLPARARFAAEYAFASDNSYPNDFSELGNFRDDPFLTAGAFVSAPVGKAGVAGGTLGAEYRNDLQNPNDTDRDPFILQRLPTVQLQTLPAQLPFARWLVPALDVDYAWFQQEDLPESYYDPVRLVTTNGRFLDTGIDGLPDSANGTNVEQGRNGSGLGVDPNNDDFGLVPGGTEGDGIFQEGELLADEGHRLLFHPRIGAPIRIADSIELYPEVGWQETFYQSRAQGSERRGIFTARVEASTRFRGELAGALHLFEPKVAWALVEAPGQSGDPLFVPATAVPQTRLRDLDLANVTQDTADRIGDFNAVTLGFENRFYRRGSGAGEGAELLADFVVQALYDIENTRFGSIFLDGRTYPLKNIWTRFSLGVDAQKGRLDEALFQVGWDDDRGDGLRVGYRYLRNVPMLFEAFPLQNRRFEEFDATFSQVNQFDTAVRIALTRGWAVGYRFAYSFEHSLLIGNAGYVEYVSKCECWGLALELGGSREHGFSVNVRYHLVGLGDDASRRRRTDSARRSSLDAFGGV